MSNQVLSHMNEMALNLVLFAKLEIMAIVNTYVKMQQSLQVRELHRLLIAEHPAATAGF
ncbi:hypothetical protein [Succinivibrio dextrinosolvens]|uniref:hypothetical protein n=1 Tax=Succinivibrio dextrinosolvens TaxID=83771 RepID=UPI0013E9213E|nr:hypothetical protein [Succinivibrio dextrinosolvens]